MFPIHVHRGVVPIADHFVSNSNRPGDRLLRVTIELNFIVFTKKCFNGAGMSHSSASPKSRFTVCTNVLKVMTSQKVGGGVRPSLAGKQSIGSHFCAS